MTLALLFPVAIARVLDTLLLDPTGNRDLSAMEITKMSMCSWRTVFRVMNTLKAMDIVTVTRTVGRAKMYKINRKSPIAKYLILFCVELDRK